MVVNLHAPNIFTMQMSVWYSKKSYILRITQPILGIFVIIWTDRTLVIQNNSTDIQSF